METFEHPDIKAGYLNPDLSPIKCYCGCKKFKAVNEYRVTESVVGEYDLECTKCKRIAAHWAYGNFVLL